MNIPAWLEHCKFRRTAGDKHKEKTILFVFINKSFCSRKALLKESMKHVFNDDLSKAIKCRQLLPRKVRTFRRLLQLVKLNSCLLTRLSF